MFNQTLYFCRGKMLFVICYFHHVDIDGYVKCSTNVLSVLCKPKSFLKNSQKPSSMWWHEITHAHPLHCALLLRFFHELSTHIFTSDSHAQRCTAEGQFAKAGQIVQSGLIRRGTQAKIANFIERLNWGAA